MKKTLLFLFLSVSLLTQAQNIGELFKKMPAELFPGVSEANKTMLLVDSGITSVPYALGEIKKLEQSHNYLKLQTSEVGTTQLKLLPITPHSAVICFVRTVCESACDSHITFYTTEWQMIEENSFLPVISEDLFFDSSKKGMENYKYTVSLHHIFPISAAFRGNDNDLLLTFNYKSLLSDDQIAEMTPFLKSDTALLHWENAHFKHE